MTSFVPFSQALSASRQEAASARPDAPIVLPTEERERWTRRAGIAIASAVGAWRQSRTKAGARCYVESHGLAPSPR